MASLEFYVFDDAYLIEEVFGPELGIIIIEFIDELNFVVKVYISQ